MALMLILANREAEYFSQAGWTTQISLKALQNFDCAGAAISGRFSLSRLRGRVGVGRDHDSRRSSGGSFPHPQAQGYRIWSFSARTGTGHMVRDAAHARLLTMWY